MHNANGHRVREWCLGYHIVMFPSLNPHARLWARLFSLPFAWGIQWWSCLSEKPLCWSTKGSKEWSSSTTKEELIALMGISTVMGVISLPYLDDYWSADPIWVIMPHDYFCQLLCYVHFADNSTSPSHTDPNYDKLWKVCPLLDVLTKTCPKVYASHQQLSIDHLSLIQYMPKSPRSGT